MAEEEARKERERQEAQARSISHPI